MTAPSQPKIADLDRMKKASSAIYLACEASVADDISAMLKAAIAEIEGCRACRATVSCVSREDGS